MSFLKKASLGRTSVASINFSSLAFALQVFDYFGGKSGHCTAGIR